MLYNYPRTKFVGENNIMDQTLHVQSEVSEVNKALNAWLTSGASSPSAIQHLAEELHDVCHSAETALRILEEKHGINPLTSRIQVIKKNQERGYYSDKRQIEAYPLPSLWNWLYSPCLKLWRHWTARFKR